MFDKRIKHEKTESGFRFECPISDTTNLVVVAVQSVTTTSIDVSGGGNVTAGSGEGSFGRGKNIVYCHYKFIKENGMIRSYEDWQMQKLMEGINQFAKNATSADIDLIMNQINNLLKSRTTSADQNDFSLSP